MLLTYNIAVLNAWTEAIDISYAVDTMYLNVGKAFDTVPHTHDQALGLQGRRQRVAVTGAKSASDWCPVSSSVPQRGVIDPVVFVMSNDLPEVTQSSAQMFADDTTVFTKAWSVKKTGGCCI